MIRYILVLILLTLWSCSAKKNLNVNVPKTFDWPYYIEKANFEEDNISPYELPAIFAESEDELHGFRLNWLAKRRPEILELFRSELYGRVPEWNGTIEFSEKKSFLSIKGKAKMKEVIASFINNKDTVKMNILICLPNNDNEKYPLFVGLNFFGNHTVLADSNITIADGYVINKKARNITHHRSTEAKRGLMQDRWPIEMLIDRGYGLATVFYGDIDPDFDDGFQNGIHPLLYKKGQIKPEMDEWGSISAWAWGLSRAMDYFEEDGNIDENKIAVIGHSRLGKAALWAGVQDKRFALTISNNSGSGGAALYKRKFGETINASLAYSPQWYCGNFMKYNDKEETLPIDQHMLISLIAPRPVYIASATEDHWADPKGEFLAAKYAEPAYHLFNKKGIETDEWPKADHSVGHSIGYHIRTGKHGITDFDWNKYIDFSNRHFAVKKKVALTFDDGPDSIFTGKILDVLKKYDIQATFFLVGKNIVKYPEVVKRISEEAHLIGNHSFSHFHLNEIADKDSVILELEVVDSLVEHITSEKIKYFRPPYGHLTNQQKEYLEDIGYKVVLWDIDPEDWNVDHVDKDDIVSKIKEDVFDGADILLHATSANESRPDRYRNMKNTLDALPEIIEYLIDKNYEFVSIDKIYNN